MERYGLQRPPCGTSMKTWLSKICVLSRYFGLTVGQSDMMIHQHIYPIHLLFDVLYRKIIISCRMLSCRPRHRFLKFLALFSPSLLLKDT